VENSRKDKDTLWIQSASAKLVMSGIAGAEHGTLISGSGIEPWVLERPWVFGEEGVMEWRVVDMELFWGYTDDWPCRTIRLKVLRRICQQVKLTVYLV
jgi:hypothetical protein